jgi:hypothetical protein
MKGSIFAGGGVTIPSVEDSMKRQPLEHYDPPRLLLIASLGLTFAPMWSGCGEAPADTGQPIADCEDEPGHAPEIEVDPPSIDFGAVDPATMAEIVEEISICNRGDQDLHLQNLELRDADAAFELGHVRSTLVDPDTCTSVEVIFRPQAGVVSEDAVVIDCDDEDCEGCPQEVPLRGEGL